jgi:hypothetical protein
MQQRHGTERVGIPSCNKINRLAWLTHPNTPIDIQKLSGAWLTVWVAIEEEPTPKRSWWNGPFNIAMTYDLYGHLFTVKMQTLDGQSVQRGLPVS